MELQAGAENVSLQFRGEEVGQPYPFHYQLFTLPYGLLYEHYKT
jgi:hypothetical protein